MAPWLTGVHPKKTQGADIQAGASVDQIAAKEIGNLSQFPSLELGLEDNRMAGGCDSGYSCAYSNTISWRSPSTPLPPEINPQALFERLFGDGETTGPAARARQAKQDRSVLDFVRADADRLGKGLGAGDKQKLSECLESVREPPAGIPPAMAPGRYTQAMEGIGPVPIRNGYAMVPQISPAAKKVGFWSAVLATVFSVAYIIGQLAEWLGWLGSGGGHESASTPLGLVVLLTPSLFLGPSFLLVAVSIHELASSDRKIWSHAAVVFATVYTVLISINYFVQLTWVTPRLAAGRTEGIEQFLFVPFDSFLYAVDILGYSFMSLATLFAAMVFTGTGVQRVARWFLISNGLLLPFIALQMYWHWLIWVAAMWAVTFPCSTWSVAVVFRRAATTATCSRASGG